MKSMVYCFSTLSEKIGEKIRQWTIRSVNEGKIKCGGKLVLKRGASVLVKKNGSFRTGKGTVTIREGSRVIVEPEAEFIIGNDVGINSNCYIAVHNSVSIGNDTIFGPGVVLVDHDHDRRAEGGLKAGKYKVGSVRIGNNVWIGANTVILRDTEIGDNAVVGAGCVVKGTVKPGSVVKRNDIV